MAGEGQVYDGSVPEGAQLYHGDVVRRQGTPEEIAAAEANLAEMQTASDTSGVPGERHVQRFDNTGGSPEITSVPGVTGEPVAEAPASDQQVIESSDVPTAE